MSLLGRWRPRRVSVLGRWRPRGVSVLGRWRPRRMSAGQASPTATLTRFALSGEVVPSCGDAGLQAGFLVSSGPHAWVGLDGWPPHGARGPLPTHSWLSPAPFPSQGRWRWARPGGSAVPVSWRLGRESVRSSLCPHRLSFLRVNRADPRSAQRECGPGPPPSEGVRPAPHALVVPCQQLPSWAETQLFLGPPRRHLSVVCGPAEVR